MSRVQDKATTERNTRTLRELVKRPENKVCADCKRNDPRWASWNLGVFVCIRCSGVHRGMGTHISKVKSVDLDTWTPEQMESITRWGNARANAYWEAHLKQGHAPPDHKIESFIRSKYESRRWAREGPPPEDPSVLDTVSSAAEQSLPAPPPASPPTRQQAAPATTSASSATARGVVNTQPVAHRSLLSAQQLRERPPGAASPNPPAAASGPSAPAPPAPKPVDDIFSLDFNAPPAASAPAQSSSHSPAASKDVKTDIMSLFSKGPAPGSGVLGGGFAQPQAAVWGAAPAPVQQHHQQPQPGAWQQQQQQPVAAGGDFGVWGSAPAAHAPAQQAFGGWGTSAPVPTQHVPPAGANVWGAPAASQAPAAAGAGFGADIWGGSGGSGTFGGGASAQPAKKDAFSDLWSGFK